MIEVSNEINELLEEDLKDIVRPSEKPESPVPEEPKAESKEEKKDVETAPAEPPVKETKPQVS